MLKPPLTSSLTPLKDPHTDARTACRVGYLTKAYRLSSVFASSHAVPFTMPVSVDGQPLLKSIYINAQIRCEAVFDPINAVFVVILFAKAQISF